MIKTVKAKILNIDLEHVENDGLRFCMECLVDNSTESAVPSSLLIRIDEWSWIGRHLEFIMEKFGVRSLWDFEGLEVGLDYDTIDCEFTDMGLFESEDKDDWINILY